MHRPSSEHAYETLENPARSKTNLNLTNHKVNSIKLETGLRPNSAGIPYTLLLRIEAIEFPALGLLLYTQSPAGQVEEDQAGK